ncbi:hypothetical protein BU15DRAFT_48226 [Melanogaster broomeanus]|nr:hypothetical protein BU15DRAFT_48226 [Melanogaster broomeanus]
MPFTILPQLAETNSDLTVLTRPLDMLFPSPDFSATCSPKLQPGPPSEEAQVLSDRLNHALVRLVIMLGFFAIVVPYLLAPRLILSVREVHSHLVGEHTDTGFGFHSKCFSTSCGVVFANPAGGKGGAVQEVQVAELVIA